MDIIRACFYDFYFHFFTQLTQNLTYTFSQLIVYYFPPILRCKYYGILNHTDLYEYKHGKMLMHLKFCFESIPNESTPATMLRYYRQRKGLTTRQLAESVKIVPATLLMYEREQFPIPYQTAVAMAEVLEIDKNLLFDEFAQFMNYPYNDKLQEVRKTYGLNQATFDSQTLFCFLNDLRKRGRTMEEITGIAV